MTSTSAQALRIISANIDARDDDQAARSVVAALASALPPGGWLAVGDLAGSSPGLRDAMACYNATGAAPYHVRSPFQLACFLEAAGGSAGGSGRRR
jgi:hypothetical protein